MYTNSPLVTYTNLANPTHYYGGRTHEIDTITIHCYVGQVTAKQGCDYFKSTSRICSANYVVGKDGDIGLCVEEKNAAATSSNKENDNRAITIEVACSTKPPYEITEFAYNSLVDLCADICKRNNIRELKWEGNKNLIGQINRQNITLHRWFANTLCPGDYIISKLPAIVSSVNRLLKTQNLCPYKVQTGAFSTRDAAEKYAEKLKEAGFPVYIIHIKEE